LKRILVLGLNLAAGRSQTLEARRTGAEMVLTAMGQAQPRSIPAATDMLILDNLVPSHYQLLLDRVSQRRGPFPNRGPCWFRRPLRRSMLVLQGGKDIQVTRTDYDLIAKALALRPPDQRESLRFPDLNHLMMPVD
jgi:hypothetical protein